MTNQYPTYLTEIVAFEGKSIRSTKQFRFFMFKLNAAKKAHQKAGLKLSGLKLHMQSSLSMIDFCFEDSWVAVESDSLHQTFFVHVYQGDPNQLVDYAGNPAPTQE